MHIHIYIYILITSHEATNHKPKQTNKDATTKRRKKNKKISIVCIVVEKNKVYSLGQK
jgi:hypothetical protein